MRSVDFNVRPELAGRFPASQSLAIYEQMSRLRYFEAGVINAVNRKEIRNYVCLSTGEEAVAAALSTVLQGYQIYAQHRSHDFYLFFGGAPVLAVGETEKGAYLQQVGPLTVTPDTLLMKLLVFD